MVKKLVITIALCQHFGYIYSTVFIYCLILTLQFGTVMYPNRNFKKLLIQQLFSLNIHFSRECNLKGSSHA